VGGAAALSVNLGPFIYRKLLELKVEILHTFYYVEVHFTKMNFFR